MSPIIVAALPILNNLSARDLVGLSERILHGLLPWSLPVISYSHNGTETERVVQQLLFESADSYHEYSIASPAGPGYDLHVKVAVFGTQPVVFVQDSLHTCKTFRNNLFLGAHLLVLGNYVALYCRIRAAAFEDNSPLYHRDVEKLD